MKTFILIVLSCVLSNTFAAESPKTFDSPSDAVSALVSGIKSQNADALRAIFGPGLEEIQNPDRIQATNEFRAFAAALDRGHTIRYESTTNCTLELGEYGWPFPVPIVQQNGKWLFDTQAGKEELLNRRIGRNELAVLDVMRSYVDAQREYARQDRNGDEVLEYAQRISSSPGKTDGLFWPTDLNGEMSPLGPWVAMAQTEGYFKDPIAGNEGPTPFHGYLFKILTSQGKHAPGGKYNYIINGHMIGGFAMVAWPAEYGQSGIMTFIVNQQGRVYQKDLGTGTAKTARKMKTYDPDSSWQISED